MLIKRHSKKKKQKSEPKQDPASINIPLKTTIEENKKYLQEYLDYTSDLGERWLTFNGKKALLMYFVPLMDSVKLNEHVIKPMLLEKKGDPKEVIQIGSVNESQDLHEVITLLCRGGAILFLEDVSTLYIIDATLPAAREVNQAIDEKVVRGSHEGFVENLDKNINLMRQRFLNGSLIVKYVEIGTISRTRVAVLYLKGISNPKYYEEVFRRLEAIDVDAVESGSIIEEALENSPFSPFPQLLNTERPDRVMGNLLEGRIAIMTAGNSSTIVAPSCFFTFYQSPEDYNTRSLYGSFFRLLRIFSFFVAISLPALYIATISFHYELIPVDLILTVKSSVDNVPFPPIAEAFIMVLILELLKEAAIRLPSSIAQTIGVVGGLVIGTAIVEANLVSNIMIIVIALTAIASFVVPTNEMSTTLRILSFPMMVGAALFGYLGIIFVLTLIIMHLVTLESIGKPYLIPIAPLRIADLKDVFIRINQMYMNDRPIGPKPLKRRKQRALRDWEKDE